MISQHRRVVALLSAVVAAATLLPAASFARPTPGMRASSVSKVAARGMVGASAGASAAPDWREPADDTTSGAQDLTRYVTGDLPLAGWGTGPAESTHTVGWASNDSTLTATDARGDQDWYKFSVTAAETVFGKPYTIEAKALEAGVDPVVEVYGPVDGSHSIAPADPRSIFGAGGETDLDVGNPTCVAANDNGPWFGLGRSSSVWFMPAVADHTVTYYFRVRPHFGATYSGETTVALGYMDSAGLYKVRIKAASFTRLAGATRIGTAVSVSQERFATGELPSVSLDGNGTVIVANAFNYPDALAGCTLAGSVNGPILLTAPNALSPEVAAEITRLGANRVFLLGSTNAVSQHVEDQLSALVPNVERLSGQNRVDTAVSIATRTAEGSSISACAFVANGWSFPDALSASPMAAYNVAPILLTHQNNLDASVAGAIGDLGITDVVIVGGTAAVSTTVQNQLATLLGGMGHVKRIGGAGRYETSRDFAMFATGGGISGSAGTLAAPGALRTLDYTGMAVCSGTNFPDALSGGAFAGGATSGFPLLLTPGAGTLGGDAPSAWIYDLMGDLSAGQQSYMDSLPGGSGAVRRSYVIGGPGAVSANTYTDLDFVVGLDLGTLATSAQGSRTPLARLAAARTLPAGSRADEHHEGRRR